MYLGHVDKPWLPMISDCGVLPPEKYSRAPSLIVFLQHYNQLPSSAFCNNITRYIFRVGLITSAGLLLRAS